MNDYRADEQPRPDPRVTFDIRTMDFFFFAAAGRRMMLPIWLLPFLGSVPLVRLRARAKPEAAAVCGRRGYLVTAPPGSERPTFFKTAATSP